VEGEEPAETVSQIFREVREAQKAEAERGGGRGGPARGGGRPTGGRSASAHGSRSSHGGHDRGAKPAPRTEHPKPAVEAVPATATRARTDAARVDPALEAGTSTRKPRRRRGGRRAGTAEGAPAAAADITQRIPEVHAPRDAHAGSAHATQQAHAPLAHVSAPKPEGKTLAGKSSKPSLLGKIKQGLKKLVKRPPRSGH
jgi:hypothetical protein